MRPPIDAPSAFLQGTGPWRPAQPQRIDSQHPCWSLHADGTLDQLIARANADAGVAWSAYDPAPTLGAGIGSSSSLAALFTAPPVPGHSVLHWRTHYWLH